MIKLWSIGRNTFIQTIRQPIFGVLLFSSFIVLVIGLAMAGWTLGYGNAEYEETDQRMLVELGLGTLLIGGLLLAVFSASGAISREIEDRTALTVISKPVSRATFILGKFAGVAAAVVAGFYLMAIVFFLTVRHKVVSAAFDPYDMPVIIFGCSALGISLLAAVVGNIFFGWHFVSSLVVSMLATFSLAMSLVAFIGGQWVVVPFGEGISLDIVLSVVLILMAVLVFVGVAIAVSTRCGQVVTLLICLGVLLVGSMHAYLFGDSLGEIAAAPRWTHQVVLLQGLSLLVPKLNLFYTLDALANKVPIPLSYVGLAGLYCATYVAASLAIAVALFQRRSLEAEGGSAAMPALVNLLAWVGRLAAIVLAIIALEGILSFVVSRWNAQYDLTIRWLAGMWGQRSDLWGLMAAGSVLLEAAAMWFLASRFGRGSRWAYLTVGALSAAALIGCIGLLAVPKAQQLIGWGAWGALAAEAGVAALLLLILLLPSTRSHFKKLA